MPRIENPVFDAALQVLIDDGDRLDLCSQEPTNYTEATSTYSLGNQTSITIGTIADGDVSGRKVTVSATSGGTIDATGTATHYAISNVAGTQLLAAGDLTTSQQVVSGNTFTTEAFDIELPDPV
jgi:hypothetical protein